jgi:hypothetical protein
MSLKRYYRSLLGVASTPASIPASGSAFAPQRPHLDLEVRPVMDQCAQIA